MPKHYIISASNVAKFLGIGFSKVDRRQHIKPCYSSKNLPGLTPAEAYMDWKRKAPTLKIQNEQANKAKQQEEQDIDLFESDEQVQVTKRNEDHYLKKLNLDTENEYYVYGLIDGMIDDKYLFELKRCAAKYKKTIGPWNQVQLETLMYLTDLKESILLKKDKSVDFDDEPNKIKYNRDNTYWNNLMRRFERTLVDLGFEEKLSDKHVQKRLNRFGLLGNNVKVKRWTQRRNEILSH